jgi:phytoene dehydrogenase-like protein
MNQYDVTIIGGGISGLTAAAILSRAGQKVAVFEMSGITGGYLAGFERKGFVFDSAIHWLNQCNEKGHVYKVLSSVGNSFPKVRDQVKIKKVVNDKLDFLLTSNPEYLKSEIIKAFPHEQKGVEKFFNSAKKVADTLNAQTVDFRDPKTRTAPKNIKHYFDMAKFGLKFLPYIFYSGDDGVKKGLKKYFKDPELIKLWKSEPDILSCLIPIAWAYNNDYQLPPVGGGQVIPRWLEKTLKKYGGEVYCNSKVTKIIDDGKKAVSIVVEKDGTETSFKSQYIISASDSVSLFEKIMRPKLFGGNLLEQLKSAELYSSAVTVYLGLNSKAEELGFGEETIFITKENISRSVRNSGDPELSDITVFSPSARDRSMAPENKGTLTIFVPAYFSQFNNWETEKNEHGERVRGEKYKKLKKEYGDILIERVEKELGIDIASKIEFMDVATPLTYERYTGNRYGTMMGARPCSKNFKSGIAKSKTPLKNVFLCGHWAALGGGVPVAVSTGANAALLVLKNKKSPFFQVFRNYFDDTVTLEELNKKIL